jgi:deazaflavin-dependent oxidoreductase (nitroreductase family)
VTLPRPILELAWAFHRVLFRMTGGRVGTERAGTGLGTLFLTTTGRRSGQPRRTAVYYVEDDGRQVVVNTNAGADRDPAWWRNLQADPHATVDLPGEQFAVRARRATSDEESRLWPRLVDAYPRFATYRAGVDREIAVVILERAALQE